MYNTELWSKEWMDAQRQYWQTLTDMGLNTIGGKSAMMGDGLGVSPSKIFSPWEVALDHWWKTLAPNATDVSKATIERLIEQGKQFLRISDELYRHVGKDMSVEEWHALVQKVFTEPFKNFTALHDGNNDTAQRMLAFWEALYANRPQNLDNWQRIIASLSQSPMDTWRDLTRGQLQDGLNRILNAPGFGYAREDQDRYQALLRCGINYQNAMQNYLQFFAGLGIKASELMRSRLQEMNTQGSNVDTAKGLYDLWVGCCEEVYGEQVMSPEYAKLHGNLVNALMAYKQQSNAIVDGTMEALNMPTRAELHTMQDRLQETRRENKNLRRDLDALSKLVATLDAGVTPVATVALTAAGHSTTPPRVTTATVDSTEY